MVSGARHETGLAMVKNNSQDSLNRRGFLSKLWLALGVVALAEFIFSGLSFLLSEKKSKDIKPQSRLIAAGAVTDFSPGTATLIREGNLYLSRLDDGGFLAISRKCTHLGCAVPWISERRQFECPCHSSIFDMTGNVIKSPAPRPLDLYPVSFVRDIVMIDIGKATKRSAFTAGQLVYAAENAGRRPDSEG